MRARAIEAIVALRLKSGVRPLIQRLAAEDGRLRGDAYAALKRKYDPQGAFPTLYEKCVLRR